MLVLALLLGVVLWRIVAGTRGRNTISYTELTTKFIAAGNVNSVKIVGDRLEATLRKPFGARRVVHLGSLQVTPSLVDSWADRGIVVEFRAGTSLWDTITGALPYITILAVVYLLFRYTQGGQKGVFSFGESRAREIAVDMPGVTFAEVAGIEEAKQELQEIVEFLRDPRKFQRLGGRIPKGVLMVGPPGTGKTYLARAIAGEARVPFFSISGSDFVEMFVGVGASRVRDLFEKAKKRAPCIVFIDEIDAVGRHRGAGLGGGHDEREQTLNQLLVEMDGFSTDSSVILMAATNRPDVLDQALLRPGRFDRHVVINMPDVRGREGILRIHTRNIPLSRDVDLQTIAKGTPGLSGADLRNLANEAALLAARNNRNQVGMREFEIAKEKVMWGSERRSLVMSEEERRVTAVHEAGHALVAICLPGADPVQKVTIVPRGRALGLTAFLPDKERHTVSRQWCDLKLTGLLGGRAAEEVTLNEVTNGSANDIELATELARKMVCEWGMSEAVGPVSVGRKDEELFVAKELSRSRTVSEQTMQVVDREIAGILQDALQKARRILAAHRPALDALASGLLAREVLDRQQIDTLVGHLLKQPGPALTPETEVTGPRVIDRATVTAPPPPPEEKRKREAVSRPPRKVESEAPKAEEVVLPVEDVVSPVVEVPEPVEAPETRQEPREDPVATVAFGRRPKTVRRSGLPPSKVPETGIPVVSIVSEAPIQFGRRLRPEAKPKPVEELVEFVQGAPGEDSKGEQEGLPGAEITAVEAAAGSETEPADSIPSEGSNAQDDAETQGTQETV